MIIILKKITIIIKTEKNIKKSFFFHAYKILHKILLQNEVFKKHSQYNTSLIFFFYERKYLPSV